MDPIEVYERCLSDKPYSKELKIYTENYLRKVIKELEILEEYEKCSDLVKFIEIRFSESSVI
jgi:hypothetical protein